MTTRYGAFTLRTQCRHCGHPVPVNAPLRECLCTHCQRLTPIPAGAFAELLWAFDDHHARLPEGQSVPHNREVEGITVTATFRRLVKPLCEKCNQPYRDERIAEGETKDIFCSSCGDPASTTPIPAWLRAVVPQARQLVSIDRGAGSPTGPAPEGLEEAQRPVVMACPQCGGSLRITSETARTVPCGFCATDVYLPDPLWQRLHPVRTVREWFVRFEGPTRPEAEAERQAAVYHQLALEEAARARTFDGQVDRLVQRGWLLSGAYAAIALALSGYFLLGLVAGVGPDPGDWWWVSAAAFGAQTIVGFAAILTRSAIVTMRGGPRAAMLGARLWQAIIWGPFIGGIIFATALSEMSQLPGARPSERRPLVFFFVLHFLCMPAEVVLGFVHYRALGTCPTGQIVGPRGTCVSCGHAGEACCPGYKGGCSCTAPAKIEYPANRCR